MSPVKAPANSAASAKAVLVNVFKHEAFRKHQLQSCIQTLAGRDSLIILPTGGGKSLFFQVPMLVAHQTRGAVGLVVSPLVSLMVDQVSHLRSLGIRAAYITFEKDAPPIGSETGALRMLAAFPPEGEAPSPIVYLSAEMVESKLAVIQDFAKNHSASLIAIDEAHCISSWGDGDRRLSKLREALPDIPCIALTATANQRVKDDIISSWSLNHRNGAGIIQESVDRPNIRLKVQKKPENEGELVCYCSWCQSDCYTHAGCL